MRLRSTQKRLLGALAAAALAAGCGVVFEAWSRAELVSPPPTLIVTDRHGRFLTEVGEADPAIQPFEDALGFWPMDPMPPKVAAATLAAEDRRFYRHPGVDVGAVARALVQNRRAGRRISGASTIAMQVARMQNPGPRTYRRKAMEALTAIFLVSRHGREELLGHYLRVAPYGNRMRGFGYAARGYFDKPVEDLSWAEAALIAALPQSPSRMDPYDWQGRPRAVERGRRILDALLEGGAIESGEHAVAHRQIGLLRMAPKRQRPEEAMHLVLRLVDRLVDTDLRYSLAHRPIIEATVDLDVQREVLSLLGDTVVGLLDLGARNGAVIVVDLEGNEVLAYVGSADYFDSRAAGSIDYATVPRSPGSTLKPLLYALGLERGTITPASILDDLPHTIEPVANADLRFLGPMLPRMALANSRNVPAMRLQGDIGLDEVHAFLRDLELHDGALSPAHYGSGLSLGAMPVTLEALVRSYTALAGGGRLAELELVRDGVSRPSRRVLSERTARQISLFLSDPMARLPSFPRMGALEYSFPVAVKTGTASGYRDAWTLAYSGRYLVGVWIGHPDWRPMNRVGGVGAAAPLARDILVRLEGKGAADGGFSSPEGAESVVLCALTGELATHACDRTLAEWVFAEARPTEHCRAHMSVAVDRASGLIAPAGFDPAELETRTFLNLGPRYAAWAAASGLPPSPSAALRNGGERSRLGMGALFAPTASVAGFDDPSPPTLSISSPIAGSVLLRDPETPAQHSTLALEAVVDPALAQVVWYVDGEPYQVVEHPYTTRWPLRTGESTFQVRTTDGAVVSETVRVLVRN